MGMRSVLILFVGALLFGFSFSSQNVAELCLLAEGSRMPGLQSLEIHKHGQEFYAEVILHLLQSLLLFALPGSSPLKVKTVAENRISGRRNTAISSPLHVSTAAFHPDSFSPSPSGHRLKKQSTICF